MSRLNVANFRHPDGTADNINLDSSGNVGIGTATPTDYNGNADNLVIGTSSGNNGITVASGTTSEGSVFFADGTTGTAEYAGYVQYNHNDNYLRFGSASTEALRLDSSQNLQFNSGYGSVATAYGVRAWVNFNGSSMSIRGSGNISSITDNGTGDYTLNFSTSFPDTNYAPSGSCRTPGSQVGIVPQFDVWNTGTLRFYTYNFTPTGYDQTQIAVAIYR